MIDQSVSKLLTGSAKTVNGVTTRFLYDGDQIIAEVDATDTTTKTYLYGPGIDEPLQMTQGTEISYLHGDGLGSIRSLSSPSGEPSRERYVYDAFGTPMVVVPGFTGEEVALPIDSLLIQNRLLFTGREYDPESGLYHYRARTYHPFLGRFLQRDPLGYLPDINLYRYAGNNPVNFVDPFGEVPVLLVLLGRRVAQAAVTKGIPAGAGVGFGSFTAARLRGAQLPAAALAGVGGSFRGLIAGTIAGTLDPTGRFRLIVRPLAGATAGAALGDPYVGGTAGFITAVAGIRQPFVAGLVGGAVGEFLSAQPLSDDPMDDSTATGKGGKKK